MGSLVTILTALAPLLTQLFQIIVNAAQAKTEDHAKIVADLQQWATTLQATIAGMASTLAADDAKIDAELAAKPPV